ncbi:thiol peroxidase [Polaribacter sp. MED152]|uniref:thiol peroxidase n=1 Tax=Polaribacter sp. MED152 TaxID=313598 RepID=UPI000068C96E|nr:thiol peroxidase [Polaribacter sp. MED152]EAQ41430.1 redoxin [Polaribacter sp. MED152]
MAGITLGGNPINTVGDLPKVGEKALDFNLKTVELKEKSLADYSGKNIILNIFPSVDTGVCAQSVREFNKKASDLENTVVLCISRDLPFAQARFCGAEGIDNVEMLSDFEDGSFGKDYQVTIADSAFKNLHSRAIVIIDADGKIVYTEQVPEIGSEPNYDAALEVL